jgi:glycerol dehydrogenase-like iron-containing ADH family enzyme
MQNTSSAGLGTNTAVGPAHLYRGYKILDAVPLSVLGKRLLVIGGQKSLAILQERLSPRLSQDPELQVIWALYGSDATEEDGYRLQKIGQEHGVTGVLGGGGGKAIDLAKWVANLLQCPIATVPTSAATCAGWSALSNLYSEAGAFQRDIPLDKAPDLLILDYDILKTAPSRTLKAGIGDALAKWYEASVSSGSSEDALVIAAVQQARVLRDLLLQNSAMALQNPGSTVWQQVVDSCICLAGVVGGLGGARCRTVAAHAVHNGLTHLLGHRCSLHGEKVAFGILVQQRLEEILQGNQLAATARRQLLSFYREIGLPTCLGDLGLAHLSPDELRQVAEVACAPTSDIHHLPFPVIPEALVVALQTSGLEQERHAVISSR